MKTQSIRRILIVLLALVGIAGIGAWIYQQMGGLGVTGMNNANSWGLYIICFMFFVGLSAGGLIVASSATVFGIERFHRVAKPAILLSTVCICAAGCFVLIDLGGIARVYNILLHPNFTSPLVWDMCVITIYLAINIVYLVLMRDEEKHARALRITSRVALPVAILVHSVTAWIFGLQIARVGWHSAIMAPLFVASALDSGLALLLIVLAILNRMRVFEVTKSLMTSLAGLLCACIAVDGFMVFAEVLTMGYSGGEEGAALATMASGSAAPFFWIEIVAGIVVPFIVLLFARCRANTAVVITCSALVVIGVFCKRCWLLLTSFVDLGVAGAPGVAFGRAGQDSLLGGMWALGGSYAPTGIELIVVAGVFAIIVLAYLLLAPRVLAEANRG